MRSQVSFLLSYWHFLLFQPLLELHLIHLDLWLLADVFVWTRWFQYLSSSTVLPKFDTDLLTVIKNMHRGFSMMVRIFFSLSLQFFFFHSIFYLEEISSSLLEIGVKDILWASLSSYQISRLTMEMRQVICIHHFCWSKIFG